MQQILFHIPAALILGLLVATAVGLIGLFAYSLPRGQPNWTWLLSAGAVLVVRFLLASRLEPQIPVYGYGVMLVVGFFVALQLAKFLASRSGIDPEFFVNAGLVMLLAGVAGARLSHVLENLGQYTRADRTFSENLFDAINIRSGGLTFYGGFLLATACAIAYGLWKKVPIPLGMDIVAPCLMIGLGFGRIGCFLNGCCHGAECNLPFPMAVQFPYGSNAYVEEVERGRLNPPPPTELTVPLLDGGVMPRPLAEIRTSPSIPAERRAHLEQLAAAQRSNAVHPAQLYSTFTAWMVAGILVAYFTLRPPPGRVFAMMLLIEPPTRFILEMLRAEPYVVGHKSNPARLTFLPSMSFSMVLSVALFIAGVLLWFYFRPKPGDRADDQGGVLETRVAPVAPLA